MPVLMNLVVVDLTMVFSNLTIITCLGYLVRVGALFLLGGLIAWLHKREGDAYKLFELGIAAPAMITALMNGGNAARDINLPQSFGAIVLPAEVFAQVGEPVYSFTQPPETGLQQFWRGLTGAGSRGHWFVFLTTSFSTPQQAAVQLHEVGARTGIKGRIYGPGGPTQSYVLAFGDWMSEEDANDLYESLSRKGWSVYRWALAP